MSTSINECEVCLESAKLQCPGCKTHYCSTECQKAVWYVHKRICGFDKSFIRQPDLVREEAYILFEMERYAIAIRSHTSERPVEYFEKNPDSQEKTERDVSSLMKTAELNISPSPRAVMLIARRDYIYNTNQIPLVVRMRESLFIQFPYLKPFYFIAPDQALLLIYGIPPQVTKEYLYLHLILQALLQSPKELAIKLNSESPLVIRYNKLLDELIYSKGKNYDVFKLFKKRLVTEMERLRNWNLLNTGVIDSICFDTILSILTEDFYTTFESIKSTLEVVNCIQFV